MARTSGNAILFFALVTVLAISVGVTVQSASAQSPIILYQDHMVQDPNGVWSVVWNEPNQVDVVGPGGFLPPIPIWDLYGRGWIQLRNPQGILLPIALQFDGKSVFLLWL